MYSTKNLDFIFVVSALSSNEGQLQVTEQKLDRSMEVRHLKCVILAGYDSFASVHSLRFDSANSRSGKNF